MIKDTNVLRAVLVTIDLSSEMNSKKKFNKFIIIKFVTIECILKYQSIKVLKIFLFFFFLFVCDQTYKSVCDYGKTII